MPKDQGKFDLSCHDPFNTIESIMANCTLHVLVHGRAACRKLPQHLGAQKKMDLQSKGLHFNNSFAIYYYYLYFLLKLILVHQHLS